jgi:hypothetical protein
MYRCSNDVLMALRKGNSSLKTGIVLSPKSSGEWFKTKLSRWQSSIIWRSQEQQYFYMVRKGLEATLGSKSPLSRFGYLFMWENIIIHRLQDTLSILKWINIRWGMLHAHAARGRTAYSTLPPSTIWQLLFETLFDFSRYNSVMQYLWLLLECSCQSSGLYCTVNWKETYSNRPALLPPSISNSRELDLY